MKIITTDDLNEVFGVKEIILNEYQFPTGEIKQLSLFVEQKHGELRMEIRIRIQRKQDPFPKLWFNFARDLNLRMALAVYNKVNLAKEDTFLTLPTVKKKGNRWV
jgi:hypothetical protein